MRRDAIGRDVAEFSGDAPRGGRIWTTSDERINESGDATRVILERGLPELARQSAPPKECDALRQIMSYEQRDYERGSERASEWASGRASQRAAQLQPPRSTATLVMVGPDFESMARRQ